MRVAAVRPLPWAHRRAALPRWLPPSFVVDWRLLDTRVKRVARTVLRSPLDVTKFVAWARRQGFYAVPDSGGFCVISRTAALARMAADVDRQTTPHAAHFGRILGYPPCCCRAAAQVGESRIDEWAARASSRSRIGDYALTDPSGYTSGRAAISHVPCSPTCRPSLRLAKLVTRRSRVITNHDRTFFPVPET